MEQQTVLAGAERGHVRGEYVEHEVAQLDSAVGAARLRGPQDGRALVGRVELPVLSGDLTALSVGSKNLAAAWRLRPGQADTGTRDANRDIAFVDEYVAVTVLAVDDSLTAKEGSPTGANPRRTVRRRMVSVEQEAHPSMIDTLIGGLLAVVGGVVGVFGQGRLEARRWDREQRQRRVERVEAAAIEFCQGTIDVATRAGELAALVVTSSSSVGIADMQPLNEAVRLLSRSMDELRILGPGRDVMEQVGTVLERAMDVYGYALRDAEQAVMDDAMRALYEARVAFTRALHERLGIVVNSG